MTDTGVIFEEDSMNTPIRASKSASGASSNMAAWLVKNKFANDTKGANTILLGIALTAFLASMVVAFSFVIPRPIRLAHPVAFAGRAIFSQR